MLQKYDNIKIEDLLNGKTPNIPATTSHIKKAPPVSMTPTADLDI